MHAPPPPGPTLRRAALHLPAAFAAIALAACSAEPEAPPPPRASEQAPIVVQLASVGSAAGSASLVVPGTVRLKRETQLGFNSSGRIAAILVREGDRVARGQVLARLDPTSLTAAVGSARAEAVRADADYRRLAALFAKGWVTAPRVEQARATAVAARARVDQTGFDAGLAVVRAPAAGIVLRRPAEPGQMVMPGQSVLTVGDLAGGYVLQLPMADADLARLIRGQRAAVRLAALGAAPIAAPISEIAARGDDGTGTFRVELALPALPGLRSGMIGTARLAVAETGDAALAVPATAVFQARADEGFVYVFDAAAGRVRRRLVGLGSVTDAAVAITAGLKTGERVVISGPDRLRDGSLVTTARRGSAPTLVAGR